MPPAVAPVSTVQLCRRDGSKSHRRSTCHYCSRLRTLRNSFDFVLPNAHGNDCRSRLSKRTGYGWDPAQVGAPPAFPFSETPKYPPQTRRPSSRCIPSPQAYHRSDAGNQMRQKVQPLVQCARRHHVAWCRPSSKVSKGEKERSTQPGYLLYCRNQHVQHDHYGRQREPANAQTAGHRRTSHQGVRLPFELRVIAHRKG